jgi:hypothetical protein
MVVKKEVGSRCCKEREREGWRNSRVERCEVYCPLKLAERQEEGEG